MSEPGEGLTAKQREFADGYFPLMGQRGAAKKAALAAGLLPRSAEVTASKWLRLAKVREYLTWLEAEARKKGQLTLAKQQEVRQGSAIKTAADRLAFYSRVILMGEEVLERGPGEEKTDWLKLYSAMKAAKAMDMAERGVAAPDEKFRKMMDDVTEAMTRGGHGGDGGTGTGHKQGG